MKQDIQSVLKHLSEAIKSLQDVQADSSTPLEVAIAVMVPMRRLDKCRDALRAGGFDDKASDADLNIAVAKLKAVTATTASQLAAHESNMKFIAALAQAVDAVIALAATVGATVAAI